ncbi:MAG: hypothetical protein U0R70_06400 [Solirubrobacteraceae bacterium]
MTAVDLHRLLGHLGPVAQAATNVVSIYSEAVRTGDLNPHELRRALVTMADAAMTAEGRVGEVVCSQAEAWAARA